MTRPGDPRHLLEQAFSEDLGTAGDLTSKALVDERRMATGAVVFKSAGRVAGLVLAGGAFRFLDSRVRFEPKTCDGADLDEGEEAAIVSGPARSILAAERVALNLLGRMSGIATATRQLVRAVEGTGARISDTRKTTPGMRAWEKEAVLMGGGVNHRMGLWDAVLIKDNHLALVGSPAEAVRRARDQTGGQVPVIVEVSAPAELDEAAAAGPDVILLDNMTLAQMSEAVRRVGGRVTLEASGGVSPANVRRVAETGVDIISTGWVTHSAPAVDVSLRLSGA
ncbi:MAG: carboxylating nicotinate-nucleotide diphosphorylase [Acidimicrobiia bacterium]|nr:carboxylating nicotinate-nucleotide diphosphorylase [Acidimicrobiia bacterium]MXX01696.1 carboxylating nicotinate-nucleotide diphosphorylase [Acidimicrobiia bacterium]MXY73716.1 carboxylating nicotinate-nucleotide diphosphorylase [Acidimicrobiia bacterium]MYB78855.1 carboxylating nicotinate-nucleotide diphosphorylase [Acidimicrobiia bacterium]MYD40853.1 carboxylating nicotinate-nucleotide diphosphorylase [Acidimicrobiia bacterium]